MVPCDSLRDPVLSVRPGPSGRLFTGRSETPQGREPVVLNKSRFDPGTRPPPLLLCGISVTSECYSGRGRSPNRTLPRPSVETETATRYNRVLDSPPFPGQGPFLVYVRVPQSGRPTSSTKVVPGQTRSDGLTPPDWWCKTK